MKNGIWPLLFCILIDLTNNTFTLAFEKAGGRKQKPTIRNRKRQFLDGREQRNREPISSRTLTGQEVTEKSWRQDPELRHRVIIEKNSWPSENGFLILSKSRTRLADSALWGDHLWPYCSSPLWRTSVPSMASHARFFPRTKNCCRSHWFDALPEKPHCPSLWNTPNSFVPLDLCTHLFRTRPHWFAGVSHSCFWSRFSKYCVKIQFRNGSIVHWACQ